MKNISNTTNNCGWFNGNLSSALPHGVIDRIGGTSERFPVTAINAANMHIYTQSENGYFAAFIGYNTASTTVITIDFHFIYLTE